MEAQTNWKARLQKTLHLQEDDLFYLIAEETSKISVFRKNSSSPTLCQSPPPGLWNYPQSAKLNFLSNARTVTWQLCLTRCIKNKSTGFRSILNPLLINSTASPIGTLIVSPFDVSAESSVAGDRSAIEGQSKETFPDLCFCPVFASCSAGGGEPHVTLLPPEYLGMELTLRVGNCMSLVVFEGAISVDTLRARVQSGRGGEAAVKVKSATTPGTATLLVSPVGERAVAGRVGRVLVDFEWLCSAIDWEAVGV